MRALFAVSILIAGVVSAPSVADADTVAADTGDLYLVRGPLPVGVRAGTPQTLTQFVHSESPTGPLVTGQDVEFEIIDGPNAGISLSIPSNELGLSQFRYPTKDLYPDGGTDLVRVYIDLDDDRAWDSDEPWNETELVTLPAENLPPVESATCDGRAPTITAVAGVVTVGTGGPDVILGTPFADEIHALDGDDVVCGAGGNDTLWAGGGNDVVVVGADASFVSAGDGDDVVTAAGSGHEIKGGGGNDRITTGAVSIIVGNDGDDTITVGSGSRIEGGNGNDTMSSPDGPSDAWGGEGDDAFIGVTGSTFDGGNGVKR